MKLFLKTLKITQTVGLLNFFKVALTTFIGFVSKIGLWILYDSVYNPYPRNLFFTWFYIRNIQQIPFFVNTVEPQLNGGLLA